MISTSPSISEMIDLPFGMRASKSSSTRAGLADRLGGDDADRLTDLDQLAGRQVAAVAEAADTLTRLASEHRAHLDLGHACLDQVARLDVADFGAFFDQRLLGLR